ncbi:hypothetical protein KKH39_02400 [Patescibacteria group bacterium]|nr:hypothetical protein [Patescibacteria group bacterium]
MLNPVRNSQNFTILKKENIFTIIFNWVKKILNNLLDFIWPQFCINCHREGSLCCGYCLSDIILEYDNQVSWPDQTDFYFDACYICCQYQNKTVQKILKKYKYSYLEHMANLLTDILEKQSRRLNLPNNTIICNVPLHNKKRKIRGFDQTELVAKKLAQRLDKPYYPLLKRVKHTKAQAQLDKKSREQNVNNAFRLSKTALGFSQNCPSILLIDDVVTTGSTLNQAARTLKSHGWQNISCLVIAKN